MSALSILFLVLPFPLLFIIHDAEEVMLQHLWMSAHKASLMERFPGMQSILGHLSCIDTKAFAIAATEELVVLLIATCYVFVGGICHMQIWAALFMAFSVHLVVHIVQAILVRGYVPGLVTSIVLLPYAAYGLWSIWLVMSGCELFGWGIAGIAFMVVNLRFAHWLGMRLK